MAKIPMLILLLAPSVLAQGSLPSLPRFEGDPVEVRPNMLLIIGDDLGVDLLGTYAEGTTPACTPNLDGLAAGGILFRNAWANPVCSPTRAALMTGRYSFRTGIGEPVSNMMPGLDLAEVTLPEALPGYTSSYLGKWHLAGNFGNFHPNNSGFSHFAGTIRGGVADYFQWTKVTNGQTTMTNVYATTDTTDDAIVEILTLPEPWFCVVSYHAPHSPWHEPPLAVCQASSCPNTFCGNLPPNPSNAQMGKAMVEAMDAEIGRLLGALEARDPNATVMFIGDNGSPGALSEPPFAGNHAKGSMFEGGVNVPLIVSGGGVARGESDALVVVTDLFATAVELAGGSVTTEDSVSIVPILRNPQVKLRMTMYAERFTSSQNGPPYADHERAVRNDQFKLIRIDGQTDELYDLFSDPFETVNLLPTTNTRYLAAFAALDAEFQALGI